MSFTLKDIVPWGRSFDEYVAMFALSSADLQKKILGCGDGPAAFNASLTRQGGRKQVLSVDPLYRFSPEDISKRITETYADVLEQILGKTSMNLFGPPLSRWMSSDVYAWLQ